MTAIFKRELKSYLTSMVGYLFIFFVLVLTGIYFSAYQLSGGYSKFETTLSALTFVFLIGVPILSMRVLAEERKQKTDQLLYSLPLTTWQIVGGKYLSLLAMFFLPMAIIAVYPMIFAQYGEVYLPGAYGSIFAFFVMGAALIAIGMFISALTDNQGFAAGIAIVLCLFNYFSVSLAEQVSSTSLGSAVALCVLAALVGVIVKVLTKNNAISFGVGAGLIVVVLGCYYFLGDSFENLLPKLMQKLSLFDRFTTFVNGVFDLTALVFYASVIALGLFLTVQSLEKRRYN